MDEERLRVSKKINKLKGPSQGNVVSSISVKKKKKKIAKPICLLTFASLKRSPRITGHILGFGCKAICSISQIVILLNPALRCSGGFQTQLVNLFRTDTTVK